MINIERQTGLFIAIGKRLKKRINAYAVGGTAMMFLGLKESTLDIDLVFETLEDRQEFMEALKSLGYYYLDARIVYKRKENRPEMLTLGDERFDLFVDDVVYFNFSKNMRQRATRLDQFGENFILKIASPLDIFLMKCATDRLKDMDDAKSILTKTKIDWKIVIEEAKYQFSIGKKAAIFELGHFLEKLKNKFKLDIPKKVEDELWELIPEEDLKEN